MGARSVQVPVTYKYILVPTSYLPDKKKTTEIFKILISSQQKTGKQKRKKFEKFHQTNEISFSICEPGGSPNTNDWEYEGEQTRTEGSGVGGREAEGSCQIIYFWHQVVSEYIKAKAVVGRTNFLFSTNAVMEKTINPMTPVRHKIHFLKICSDEKNE